MERQTDLQRGTTEWLLLHKYLEGEIHLDTYVPSVQSDGKYKKGPESNPIGEEIIGRYRSSSNRVNVFADTELIKSFKEADKPVPSFLEAGPRSFLTFNPKSVKAAIVTTGGIAPGLHSVIHAITQRHHDVYKLNSNEGGKLWGVRDGFRGLIREGQDFITLTPAITRNWLTQGGSQLGTIRHFGGEIPKDADEEDKKRLLNKLIVELADKIARRLRMADINILYVLGGDGSMRVAHEIAIRVPEISVACIPKTMDNDVLWVWESFGFSTAVEEATRVINTLYREAASTRRICIIELFGAESGYVAANAAMASGQVDLVLIPEVFRELKALINQDPEVVNRYWDACIQHIHKIIIERDKDPYAVIVVAEGVKNILNMMSINGTQIQGGEFLKYLGKCLSEGCNTPYGDYLDVFWNEPRHYIRAVVANANDQRYCARLGALAVDNALAGYRDFMVSQWMTEYVLVPLEMATMGQKAISLSGVFWKQVINNTSQPSHQIPAGHHRARNS